MSDPSQDSLLEAVARAGSGELDDEIEALRAIGHALLTQVPLPDAVLTFVRARTRKDLDRATALLGRTVTRESPSDRQEHARLVLTGIVRVCIAIGTPPAQVPGFMQLRQTLSPAPPPSSQSARSFRTIVDSDVAPLTVPYDDTTAPDDTPPLAVLAAYVERGAYASWVEGAADRSEDFREELLAGIEAARSFTAPISLCARLYEKSKASSDEGPVLVELDDTPQNLGRLEPFEATLELARDGAALQMKIDDFDHEVESASANDVPFVRAGNTFSLQARGVAQVRLVLEGKDGRGMRYEVALLIV